MMQTKNRNDEDSNTRQEVTTQQREIENNKKKRRTHPTQCRETIDQRSDNKKHPA